MTKEQFDNILNNQTQLKELPNTDLINCLDLLSSDFEETKTKIINMTHYLDKVEELYNKCLSEYNTRV